MANASGRNRDRTEGLSELPDAAGVRHEPAPAARIVSLVPSLTELLFDLGLGDQVVGRTAFCIHPAGRVRAAKSVGGTKTVRLEKLRRLEPTHVLVNVDETPRALAQELAAEGWTVVVTHPIEVADNLPLYRLIGGLFDRVREAEELCRRFEDAHAALQQAAAAQPAQRVLYLIWKDPWMTVSRDTYVSRMLALAGLHTLPAVSEARYPVIALDEALLEACEQILFATEPFPFGERHLDQFRARRPAHADKARLIDGEMVSWYGSRAIAGLAYLARFIASDR